MSDIIRAGLLATSFCLFFGGCGPPGYRYYGLPNVRVVTPGVKRDQPFKEVEERWTTRFTVPNPLFRESDVDLPPFLRPPDLGVIKISATLFGEEVIDSWIRQVCTRDSLSYEETERRYEEEHHPEDQFRIKLNLQSGFAKHSVDPDLWTIYLEDDKAVMYEPVSIKKGETIVKHREMPPPYYTPPYYSITIKKTEISRVVDLYFPKVTFFGKRLLERGTKSLKLVFSYGKRPIGEGKWIFEFEQKEKGGDK